MAISAKQRAALDNVLVDAKFSELPNYFRGKVRDSFDLNDGRRVMISTDRQSAFDQVLCAVPFKGQVLNQTAEFWFKAMNDICESHILEHIDPNIVIVTNLKMFPIEIVVRDYLTGSTNTSIWPMYRDGSRKVYGNFLVDGMVKNEKLPHTILTPTSKGAGGAHDVPLSREDVIERGLVSKAQWEELESISLSLFDRGRRVAEKNNLILVDTKYEFGLDQKGQIVLADEVHTPDSSRYWELGTYAKSLEAGEEPVSLDKEFLRLWIYKICDPYKEKIPNIPEEILVEFSRKYIALFERVTGGVFKEPNDSLPIRDRIKRSLETAFPEYF